MRILLLEDDLMLGKAIKNALESSNYVADWVTNFDDCEAALMTTNFEIALLDINLPEGSGLDILKKLRLNKNPIPVLILTARDSVAQKIEGLDLGADDYLSKPFDIEELFARIRSLVRRSKGIATAVLRNGDVELNTVNFTVLKDSQKIEASPKEFMILKFLLENLDKVISRARLEEVLYSWDSSVESNAVEVYIHHLRKKLGKDFIKTSRGFGYVIDKIND